MARQRDVKKAIERDVKRIFLLLWLALALPTVARADVTVTFYSHDMEALGMRAFPHAFFTVKGMLARGGPAIDTNYGWTPKSTDAALFAKTQGFVETKDTPYIARSRRHFSVTVPDATYDRLMALIASWRTRGPKGYDLGNANCISFAGAAAQTVGLKVAFPQNLMKKPKLFLDMVFRDNAALFAAR
jgi:hypothetical protein